jgi:aldehyde dehydrogenase (NAD(P)+)
MERSIQELQSQKNKWARLPIPRKIDLLYGARKRLGAASQRWVDLSVAAKGIDPDSPWVGEEWVSGPWALAAGINGYLETLETLAKGRLPDLPVRTRPDGQVIAQVYPRTIYNRLMLNGISADVWMQADITAKNLKQHMAVFYQQQEPSGKVALVLGGGNINSIPPLDVLSKLYIDGQVTLLKMHTVNDYLGPVLEEIFKEFVDAGLVRFAYGGPDVGHFLVHHEGIETIHITGSAQTHDIIVFGVGQAGVEAKQRNKPILQKPMTSELGGIGPAIIVPGPWTEADIQFQAERLATMKLHNGGFNCVASQLLVLPERWQKSRRLLAAVRDQFRILPARPAYYPGAAERQLAAVANRPGVELMGGDVPRTLITDLDPEREDEHCFNEEFFGAIYAQTSLPGDTPSDFLANAVRFCNEKLAGTLGLTILIHPKTMKAMGPVLEQALADLRYGAIGVNNWDGGVFLLAQVAWGSYPGHTIEDIVSGIGFVHNSFMFEKPQKSIVWGNFHALPRAWLHGQFHLMPKPLWFVTNKTAAVTARRVAAFTADPGPKHLPGIFASALKG